MAERAPALVDLGTPVAGGAAGVPHTAVERRDAIVPAASPVESRVVGWVTLIAPPRRWVAFVHVVDRSGTGRRGSGEGATDGQPEADDRDTDTTSTHEGIPSSWSLGAGLFC